MEVDNINKKYKNKARENLANNILSLKGLNSHISLFFPIHVAKI